MRITVSNCMAITALYHGLSLAQMRGVTRKLRVARPRQIAMTLARHFTGASLPRLGKRFGDRDHTTVLAATRRIAKLVRDGDEKTVKALTDLLALIPACADVVGLIVRVGPASDLIDWADLRRACLELDEEGEPIARVPASAKMHEKYVSLKVRQHLRHIASESDAVRLAPVASALAPNTLKRMMGARA